MKKAVVFIADGTEEIEVITPVDYLRRAGVEVTLVAVSSGNRTVTCSHKVSINADMALDTYLALGELPDAVVVPGGMPGSTNIASCPGILDFIRRMYSEKKLVCAICAAPAIVLGPSGVLKGHEWTCYPGMQENAAEFTAGFREDAPFVHHENIVTGRGPGAAEQFAMEIVSTLCGEDTARKIKSGSVQR